MRKTPKQHAKCKLLYICLPPRPSSMYKTQQITYKMLASMPISITRASLQKVQSTTNSEGNTNQNIVFCLHFRCQSLSPHPRKCWRHALSPHGPKSCEIQSKITHVGPSQPHVPDRLHHLLVASGATTCHFQLENHRKSNTLPPSGPPVPDRPHVPEA